MPEFYQTIPRTLGFWKVHQHFGLIHKYLVYKYSVVNPMVQNINEPNSIDFGHIYHFESKERVTPEEEYLLNEIKNDYI